MRAHTHMGGYDDLILPLPAGHLAGQKLRVRDQEVQLQPPLVPVLNPQHAVLVFIESGHQNPLEARHQLFTLAGR